MNFPKSDIVTLVRVTILIYQYHYSSDMNAVLQQLQKPNASMAKIDFLDIIETNLDLHITEKDLHDDNELWNLPMLVGYFIALLDQQKEYDSEDSYRDLQSTID